MAKVGKKNAGRGGRGTKQRKFSNVSLPGMHQGRSNSTIKGNLKRGSAFKLSNASTKLSRQSDPSKGAQKGGTQERTRNTIKRLELYRQKAPNKRYYFGVFAVAVIMSWYCHGEFLHLQRFVVQNFLSIDSIPRRDLHKQLAKPMRIEPDRRWFGNTRTVTQGKMEEFRDALGTC